MDLNYLILILTTRCNLKCAYCYNGDREPADMDPAVLSEALSLVSRGHGPVRLQLTGGEPALVPELIEKAVSQAKNLTRPYKISLQTNATLLDSSLVRFFKNNNIEIGISLDGPPEANDRLRGRSRELIRGLSFLEEAGCPFTVTTVVTQDNCQELYKVPLILAQYSTARGMGLDLLIRKGRQKAELPAEDSLTQAIARLKSALKLINARREMPLVLREEEQVLRAVSGQAGPFCQACLGRSAAVTPDGDVYPCGQTAFSREFYLGRVFERDLKPSNLSEHTLTGDHCRGCFLSGRCPGECPSRMFFNQARDKLLVCHMYRTLAHVP
ncbi:MAG: radical SAM protein [Deltaproteobacteria bacterium]|jgi:uncharacterized protein|nr:radical SAM protein [Deltaproteobacteria bacterium]